MFSTADTIVAIATPPGRGGIGVVRLSGPAATTIASALVSHRGRLEPRRATFTKIRLTPDRTNGIRPARPGAVPTSSAIDHVIALYFPAPHSYTGEDVVELSAHGSPVVLRAIVEAAIVGGARLAEPGEFTLRAFLNGRVDLVQAEAIADLIDAVTPLQARAAFDQLDGTLTRAIAAIDAALFDLVAKLEASVDFPDEGYHFVEPRAILDALDDLRSKTAALIDSAARGRLIREGLRVTIVGKPNVGKSSLFNALAGTARAIVHDAPGTTRDLITELVELDGVRVTLVDTAGDRDSGDEVETEGVRRARAAGEVSDVIVRVVDHPDDLGRHAAKNTLAVINKVDLHAAHRSGAISVSALTGDGLPDLRRAILSALDIDVQRDRPAITNLRHLTLVDRADAALARAQAAVAAHAGSLSEEFVLADLQDARAALEEISGRRTDDDVLAHVFSRFCVGK